MKLQSRRKYLPSFFPQSRMRVTGRWTVATTFHWSAVSFPRVVVPQFRGAALIHDGSSVRDISSHTASMMSLPSTSLGSVLGPCSLGQGIFNSLWEHVSGFTNAGRGRTVPIRLTVRPYLPWFPAHQDPLNDTCSSIRPLSSVREMTFRSCTR